MTTPSQLAKEFAAQHGFTITPNGRRYAVTKGQIMFEVGGYETALNQMKRFVAMAEADEAAHPDVVKQVDASEARIRPAQGVIRDDGVMGLPADTIVGAAVEWSDQRLVEQVCAENAGIDRARGAAAQIASLADAWGTNPALTRAGELDFALLDDAARARVRKASNRLLRERRRASGKPPGGKWHVIFDGLTVMKYGYPSRSDAIAIVRWGFNHPEPRIRNNWRTKHVTVEYRA